MTHGNLPTKRIIADINGIKIPSSVNADYKAHYFDFDLYGTVNFNNYVGAQLGYRNFNVFLNNHRIEEAKAALSDPTQAEVPVITIAMDAGFQSLGPFNRAFKATTGVTPTEYRRLNAPAA